MLRKLGVLAITGALLTTSAGCDLEDIEDISINIAGPTLGGLGYGGRGYRDDYYVVDEYYYEEVYYEDYYYEDYYYEDSYFGFDSWWW